MSKSKNYPLINGWRRRPDKERDGSKNYGKSCIVCGTSTCGEKWVQFSFMRGEDETIRVCANHWKTDETTLIEKMYEYEKQQTQN